jgi:MFS family permease
MTWINSLFVAVHLENVYFNALLFAFSNLPGNILSAFLMDRVGRKSMLVVSSLSAAASLLGFAFFASEDGASLNATGIVASACLFQAFTIAAWNTIDCMTSELFPTAVRSTGMGVCAASGRVGAMVAQFVNGALVGNPVRLLLVASTSLVIGAITPCLMPPGDMTMRPLEDGLQRRTADDVDEEMTLTQRGDYDSEVPFVSVKSKDSSYHSTSTVNRIV